MICLRENEHGADLLIGYLEDTLDTARRREIEEHADSCLECRQLLAVQETLDDFPVPEVSPDFDARLYAKIAEVESRRPWWQTWFLRPAVPLTAAAALIAGVLWVRPPAVVVQEGPKQAVVDVDILQLEQALEDMELLLPATDSL